MCVYLPHLLIIGRFEDIQLDHDGYIFEEKNPQ